MGINLRSSAVVFEWLDLPACAISHADRLVNPQRNGMEAVPYRASNALGH